MRSDEQKAVEAPNLIKLPENEEKFYQDLLAGIAIEGDQFDRMPVLSPFRNTKTNPFQRIANEFEEIATQGQMLLTETKRKLPGKFSNRIKNLLQQLASLISQARSVSRDSQRDTALPIDFSQFVIMGDSPSIMHSGRVTQANIMKAVVDGKERALAYQQQLENFKPQLTLLTAELQNPSLDEEKAEVDEDELKAMQESVYDIADIQAIENIPAVKAIVHKFQLKDENTLFKILTNLKKAKFKLDESYYSEFITPLEPANVEEWKQGIFDQLVDNKIRSLIATKLNEMRKQLTAQYILYKLSTDETVRSYLVSTNTLLEQIKGVLSSLEGEISICKLNAEYAVIDIPEKFEDRFRSFWSLQQKAFNTIFSIINHALEFRAIARKYLQIKNDIQAQVDPLLAQYQQLANLGQAQQIEGIGEEKNAQVEGAPHEGQEQQARADGDIPEAAQLPTDREHPAPEQTTLPPPKSPVADPAAQSAPIQASPLDDVRQEEKAPVATTDGSSQQQAEVDHGRQAEVDNLLKQISELKQANALQVTVHAEIAGTLSTTRQQLEDAQRQLEEKQAAVTLLQKQVSELQTENASLSERLNQSEQANSQLNTRLHDEKKANASLRYENQRGIQLQIEYSNKSQEERDGLRVEVARISSLNDQAQRTIDDLRAQLENPAREHVSGDEPRAIVIASLDKTGNGSGQNYEPVSLADTTELSTISDNGSTIRPAPLPTTAEAKATNSDENLKDALLALKKAIEDSNFKTGVFGGEKIKLADGKTKTAPKGVKQIHDLLETFSLKSQSSSFSSENNGLIWGRIQEIAMQRAHSNYGFFCLNRRQESTVTFYESLRDSKAESLSKAVTNIPTLLTPKTK